MGDKEFACLIVLLMTDQAFEVQSRQKIHKERNKGQQKINLEKLKLGSYG